MKVEVQSRKLIKPCKPTPSHLRSYNISLLDEANPSMHVIRILYYPPNSVNKKHIHLEESLAQILPLFYPLAGRYIKEKHLVDCNDDGAEYSESRVDCELFQLINGPDVESKKLNLLLPLHIGLADEATDPMLAVQINKFQCGALAIGVCASHRIFDSCSLGIFLAAWANAAADGEMVIRPDFDSPLLFPSENVVPLNFEVSRTPDESIVCKRIVFDKSVISRLRDSATLQETYSASPEWRSTPSERLPSRVSVVSAFLTQAFLRAHRAKHGDSKASLIAQAINVRERTIPPVSKHACGTWVSFSYLEYSASEIRSLECDYPGLVMKMREANIQGVKDCERIFSEKHFGRWVLVDSYFEVATKASSPDYKVIWITDWSKFGDYQLDFGFGKPVWVSLADVPLQDLFILMNTKENDGIEAWVYLHESDMPYFEQDEGIKMRIMQ